MIPMTRIRTVPAAATLALAVLATASSAQESVLQIRASEIVLGDGERIEDGVLIVQDGRVRRVGRGVEVDARHPVIDHAGVLTAGLVACQTHSGAAKESRDSTRSLLPEARLVHAFDPDHPDFERALRAGITSVVLAPAGDSVAGGITAVVKTAHGTVVKREAHLALSLANDALGRPVQRSMFPFGSAGGSADEQGGPEHTDRGGLGQRSPTSYAGAARELRARFGETEGAFARARRGELGVLLEAWDRNEVARAIESLRTLGDQGVPIAFALDAPANDPDSLRLSAAMALAAGADRATVWRALTSDAARIARVDDRVGTLERDKDADFVLWSGDPLNLASRVEAVYVDGRRAWSADPDESSGDER